MTIKNFIKKIFFVFVLNLAVLFSFGQTEKFYECKYCGEYAGKADDTSGGRINHIYVKFSLMKDSVYYYEIGGVFSWCTSKTFTGGGKWFSDNNWLYFKPDTNQIFIMFYPVMSKLTKEESNQLNKYNDKGYIHTLKILKGKSEGDKIFFRIGWDCFESYWPNNFVQKKIPK